MPKKKGKKDKKKDKKKKSDPAAAPEGSGGSDETLKEDISNRGKGLILNAVNNVIPDYDDSQVTELGDTLGTKMGATAEIGADIIKKATENEEFKEKASKLGIQVFKLTRDGILFVMRKSPKVVKPVMGIASKGAKMLFVPVQAMGTVAINAALTAASAVPPLAVAIKLGTTAGKLGEQWAQSINLAGQTMAKNMALFNGVFEMMIELSGVLPKLIKKIKKMQEDAKGLVDSVGIKIPSIPLPKMPSIPLPKLSNPLKLIPMNIDNVMALLPIPPGLGDVQLKNVPDAIMGPIKKSISKIKNSVGFAVITDPKSLTNLVEDPLVAANEGEEPKKGAGRRKRRRTRKRTRKRRRKARRTRRKKRKRKTRRKRRR